MEQEDYATKVEWLGHLCRLNEKTPARKALDEYLKESRRPAGRPKLTWCKLVTENIEQYSNLQINFKSESSMFKDLIPICADRKRWKQTVKNIMLQSATDMF